MHSNQLGIYLALNAEGLLILAEHRAVTWGCTLDQALSHLYDDFRHWCSSNSITCSHRRWSKSKLHMETEYQKVMAPSYPWIKAKAMNSRLILGWLAESWPQSKAKFSECFGIPCWLTLCVQSSKYRLYHHPTTGAQEQLSSGLEDLLKIRPSEDLASHQQRSQLWALGIATVFLS